MDDQLKRDVRKFMQSAEYDIKAGKDLLWSDSAEDEAEVRCHLSHVMRKCQEALNVMQHADVSQRDLFPGAGITVDLDSEEVTTGRVVYTPNGTEPSKEVTEEA